MRHFIPAMFVPGTTTRLLTETRKMPSASWSLPAGAACPFAHYGEGTICGDCYAKKGSYTQYPNVIKAQNTRYSWVRDCLKTDEGTDSFVATMITVIRKTTDRQTGQKYFRVHDSGDLFSPAYTWAWVRIVQALPDVRFWFPTRSWRPARLPPVTATTARLRSKTMSVAHAAHAGIRPMWRLATGPTRPGLRIGARHMTPDHIALEAERQYLARVASRVPYVTVDSNGTRYCTGCGRPITDRPHRNGYPCRTAA